MGHFPPQLFMMLETYTIKEIYEHNYCCYMYHFKSNKHLKEIELHLYSYSFILGPLKGGGGGHVPYRF